MLHRVIGRGHRDPSLVGYGGFWFLIDEAHITTLGLRPEWRGRGLGELLLASLIERALERGALTVSLEVRVSNAIAQNLYIKYGFKHVGRRKAYYSDNREDADIMTIQDVTSRTFVRRFDQLRTRLCQRLAVVRSAPKPRATKP
jgi:ribosomal-protein-alanine N-acetyltransferase